MDIRHIEHFLQLAETEHVSETADFFNISQPSLSKSIALLEAEIGTKLFDRTGNRIKLNQNGKIYLEYAEKAIDLLKTASLAANNIDNAIQGNISFQCALYPPVIVSCAKAYSKINPYVTFSNISNSTNKTPDFILYSVMNDIEHNKEQAWIAQKLFKEKYLLIASPRYKNLTHTGKSIALSTLKNEFFVAFTSDNILIKDATYTFCQNVGFYPKIFYSTNDFYLKINIVDGGCAVAIIPECCLIDALKLSPDLRYYEIEDADYERTVYIRRRREAFMSDVSKDFWYFLLDYFGITAQ